MNAIMAEPKAGTFTEYEQWWEMEAKPLYEEWMGLPFFTDLRAGKLTEERLKAWLGNWYGHVQESDMHRALLWSRHHYILGRFPEMEEIVTERAGKSLNYPYPGGHVRGLLKLSSALGVSHEQLLQARSGPFTVHLTSFLKSLYLEGTLAEFASQLIGEEYFLKFCDLFQEALSNPPFSLKGDALDYFKFWKRCLLMEHGSPGRFLLKSLFDKGVVEERPNAGVRHVGKRYAEYLIRVYRDL